MCTYAYFSHLYLSAPFKWSTFPNEWSASLILFWRKISRLRSRMLSKVSLLWWHSRQVTRDRSRPPKILWTHVVSASLGSILLRSSASAEVHTGNDTTYGGNPAKQDFWSASMAYRRNSWVSSCLPFLMCLAITRDHHQRLKSSIQNEDFDILCKLEVMALGKNGVFLE